jgi:hypothetical protein
MPNQNKTWIAELDRLGAFADLKEQQKLFERIPEEDRGHPQARWLEGLIMGRIVERNSR